ncbi:molybdate ABC transporter permease subunit [Pelobacter seleniigenes]|uniref:molybdate ABC transporter permease subunit n=1 Tax=Pelobacter seleniigenes TaxID=407188 RepID=UPI0004A6BFB4|nr:ABC transporter permease subunit [Pelobacter seleniigenes]
MSEFVTNWWQVYSSEPVLFSLGLTAKICLYALALQLLAGIPLACYLAGAQTPGRAITESLVTFPLIFPPIATGYLLLVVLGRMSPLGGFLNDQLGIEIVFSFPGIVIAAFIAGLPLVVKPVQAAIKTFGNDLVEASYTLGRGRLLTFCHVTLPGIKKSIFSGLALGLGRSLGEVGITLMLGGNIIGKTNTLSLEVFNAVYDGDFERATALCLLLFGFSLLLFASIRKLSSDTPG